MPEDGVPEGNISGEDIAELAALFDRFEYAFDPMSLRAKEAESKFEDRVLLLFRERVEPNYSSVSFTAFRCRIRSLCRAYLRNNNL
jgi:hypothetical protein